MNEIWQAYKTRLRVLEGIMLILLAEEDSESPWKRTSEYVCEAVSGKGQLGREDPPLTMVMC